jgi:hypothetical protein
LVREVTLLTLFSLATVDAATLDPNTLKAWDDYVESAAMRMEQRRRAPEDSFLWVDGAPDRLARVKAGEIVVSPVGPRSPRRVPLGLVHDWVGAAFIPQASINDVLKIVRDYGHYKDLYEPSVVDSKAIASGDYRDLYSMLLMNKSVFLKNALSADYEVCYVRLDDRRAYSIARSTRVQEIEDYGSPAQHLLPQGEGHGIIWRLAGVTRYMERDGGVYVEFEAIALSRDIPVSLRWFVEPLVRRISRSSLATSLEQTQQAVRDRAEVARAGSSLSYKP